MVNTRSGAGPSKPPGIVFKPPPARKFIGGGQPLPLTREKKDLRKKRSRDILAFLQEENDPKRPATDYVLSVDPGLKWSTRVASLPLDEERLVNKKLGRPASWQHNNLDAFKKWVSVNLAVWVKDGWVGDKEDEVAVAAIGTPNVNLAPPLEPDMESVPGTPERAADLQLLSAVVQPKNYQPPKAQDIQLLEQDDHSEIPQTPRASGVSSPAISLATPVRPSHLSILRTFTTDQPIHHKPDVVVQGPPFPEQMPPSINRPTHRPDDVHPPSLVPPSGHQPIDGHDYDDMDVPRKDPGLIDEIITKLKYMGAGSGQHTLGSDLLIKSVDNEDLAKEQSGESTNVPSTSFDQASSINNQAIRQAWAMSTIARSDDPVQLVRHAYSLPCVQVFVPEDYRRSPPQALPTNLGVPERKHDNKLHGHLFGEEKEEDSEWYRWWAARQHDKWVHKQQARLHDLRK